MNIGERKQNARHYGKNLGGKNNFDTGRTANETTVATVKLSVETWFPIDTDNLKVTAQKHLYPGVPIFVQFLFDGK